MTREAALRLLRANEAQLKEQGVIHLRLFGSVARNEATDASDLDLLADFDPCRRISLLDLVRIESNLTDIVGARVDLLEERSLREHIRLHALKEAIVAF